MATILIVEDTPVELQLMRDAVAPLGHNIIHAPSGDLALELAEKNKPALILLDVVMPGKDGFSVCRSLKKNAATESTPVIIVSSKGQDSDKFWAQKQGANDYIVKPYAKEALQAAVKRFIS